MVVITVPWRTPLRRIEGERGGGRASEREPLVSKSLSSELCYPKRGKEAERQGGESKTGRYGARREKKGRSWRGNYHVSSPAPRAKEACRWKERRIGWEIHVGDYGWRLRVGSVEKTGRGMGG